MVGLSSSSVKTFILQIEALVEDIKSGRTLWSAGTVSLYSCVEPARKLSKSRATADPKDNMLYSLLDALLALEESCIDTSDRNSDLHDKTRSHLDSLVSIISGTDHDVEVVYARWHWISA